MARSKESPTTSKDNHNQHQPTAAPPPSEEKPSRIADQHFLISSAERTLTASAIGHGNEGNGNGTLTVTGDTRSSPALLKSQLSPELVEKIKELVRLSHEQGYLTY